MVGTSASDNEEVRAALDKALALYSNYLKLTQVSEIQSLNRDDTWAHATCSPKTPPRGGRGFGLRMPAGRAPRCVGNGSPKSRSSGS
jgi:hypothetical protein